MKDEKIAPAQIQEESPCPMTVEEAREELAAVDLAFEGLEETDRARRIGHWIGLAAAETTRANAAEAELASLRAKTAGGAGNEAYKLILRTEGVQKAAEQEAERLRDEASGYAVPNWYAEDNRAHADAIDAALEVVRSLLLDPSPQSEGGGETTP